MLGRLFGFSIAALHYQRQRNPSVSTALPNCIRQIANFVNIAHTEGSHCTYSPIRLFILAAAQASNPFISGQSTPVAHSVSQNYLFDLSNFTASKSKLRLESNVMAGLGSHTARINSTEVACELLSIFSKIFLPNYLRLIHRCLLCKKSILVR